MIDILKVLAALASGYLLGSLNTAVIVGKIYGTDIRSHGSESAGLTNTLRVLSRPLHVRLGYGPYMPWSLCGNGRTNPLCFVGTIGATLLFVALSFVPIFEGTLYFHAFAFLMALIVIFKHRDNIRRLLSGTENRLTF